MFDVKERCARCDEQKPCRRYAADGIPFCAECVELIVSEWKIKFEEVGVLLA